ncbi:LOW QUALITY PROTEIN: hypothetical protein V2J09_006078 [Rumex salicifolius]
MKPKTLPCFLLLLLLAHFTNGALLFGLKYLRDLQRHRPRPVNGSPYPNLHSNHTPQCDYFTGSWVPDSSSSSSLIYHSSDCPIIDPEFNCELYGRPDSDYLKYSWKPDECELPRFDGLEFLERMRGKTVMFVGDSLGKNQWQSLICMVSSSLPKSSPTRILRGDPFSNFKVLVCIFKSLHILPSIKFIQDYSVTISFYKAPYLVDIDLVQGERVLRLDEISGNGNSWHDVDVLSFNTGHWWTHQGSLQGWDYMEFGGKMHQEMDPLIAMEKGMRTWARWVDTNVDTSRTRVFFLSVSPSHYNPLEWSSKAVVSKANYCYGQTKPVSRMATETENEYPVDCADQMKVVKSVLESMNSPAYLLDVTKLSAMRKDCHPSIYSGELSPSQRANPARYSDCSHWCLPGLPDTWNQLLYTALFF